MWLGVGINAQGADDIERYEGEFTEATTAYTDCGLDDSDTAVQTLMGGMDY